MTEIWKNTDTNEEFKIKVTESYFGCDKVTLPVITNFSDCSEESLIQLRYILNSFISFVNAKKLSNVKMDSLSWQVVTSINFVAKLFVDYLKLIGENRFFDFSEFVNLSPNINTPYCEFVFSSAISAVEKIESELENKGLKLLGIVEFDGYWD